MSPWDEGLDRRKFPRVSYPCQIVIRGQGLEKDSLLTHTENIGIGGICVILKKSLPMFMPLEIEIDVMDFGKNICCEGRVVWVVRRKGTENVKPMFYDVGIEFVGLSDGDQDRLAQIIQHLVKRGSSIV